MVPSPDLGVEAGIAQGRANLVADQSARLRRLDLHGGHVVLVVQGLVLQGDGVNVSTTSLVRLEVLDKVLGVGILVGMVELVVAGAAANQLALDLHPSGGRPGRADNGQLGLQPAEVGQHADHGVTTITQAEAVEASVDIAAGVVVSIGGISREIRAGDGVAQQVEVETRRGHQIVEQLRAGVCVELVEGSDGGIGDSSTKTLDGLLASGLLLDEQLPVLDARVAGTQDRSLGGSELVAAVLRGSKRRGSIDAANGRNGGENGDQQHVDGRGIELSNTEERAGEESSGCKEGSSSPYIHPGPRVFVSLSLNQFPELVN